MATHTQSGAWNSSSILQGYGLMATIGPYEPTKADVKRFNSRSGGAHAGHGNWMQTFNPRPVIKDGPPSKVYDYGLGPEVRVQSRLPSLATRKVSKFKGFKKSSDKVVKLGALVDIEGIQAPKSVPVDDPSGKKEVKDIILEKNRRDSDTSMGSSKQSSGHGVEEMSPPSTEAPTPHIPNRLAPIPAQHLTTHNSNEARSITSTIYGQNRWAFNPHDSDEDMG